MQQLTQKEDFFIYLDTLFNPYLSAQTSHTMASLLPIFNDILLFLVIISHPSTINSQDASSSNPTIAQCASSLLPLVPCAPFVQGLAASPGQPCCDNLKLIDTQIPQCLCLLQNDSTLTSFPINRTLALQLPAFCTLQVNVSDCPGLKLPPNSTPTQASSGTMGNPTVAASPAVPVTPKPSIIGFGLARSDAINLKSGDGFAVATTMAILFLPFQL